MQILTENTNCIKIEQGLLNRISKGLSTILNLKLFSRTGTGNMVWPKINFD